VGPLEENTKLSRSLQIGAALHHGDKKIDWCEYSDVSPGVETSPKNPQDTSIRTCVLRNHVRIFAGRQDEILD